MARKSKCQASLEYLITYAWALFIIFLVIGFLSTYLLTNSTTIELECYFGDHFFCTEAVYNNSGDTIDLVLKNVKSSVVVDGVDVLVADGDCIVGLNEVHISNIWQNDTIPVGQATSIGYNWTGSQRKIVSVTCATSGRFTLDISIKYRDATGIYTKSSTGTVRGEWI
jgi:hypothetical protein